MTSGALVLGADYRALGVVRSLGRRGVRVWVLRHGEHRLASHSRFAERTLVLPDVSDTGRSRFLIELSERFGLEGWMLVPTADETAAFVSRRHEDLAGCFRLTTPPWEVMRWCHDKRLTHRLADVIGVDYPTTWYPATREEVRALDCQFPVLLKPAFRERLNEFTADSARRADTRDHLVGLYDEACRSVEPSLIMVQEQIPGGGESQLAYAALCSDGQALASVVARRVRQYPMDFGKASTFVETIENDEVTGLAERVLGQLRFTGLVEVEFKRDDRDGRYKLLDVNPRPWGWHTVSARAGVDFPYLLWLMVNGREVPRVRARPGVRWMRMSTDFPTAAREILRGRLSVGSYLRSLRGPRESAIFARDDPVPGFLELPLLALLAGRRALFGHAG